MDYHDREALNSLIAATATLTTQVAALTKAQENMVGEVAMLRALVNKYRGGLIVLTAAAAAISWVAATAADVRSLASAFFAGFVR